MTGRATIVAIFLLAVLQGGRAGAEERRYALIIGYNGAPAVEGTEAPPPLKYADDDAMAFYELQREAGTRAILLASPDSDTRSRYPQFAEEAQAPSIESVDRAMADLGAQMLADTRAGRSAIFYFFYSGHGVRGRDGQGALTLMNGALSRQMLYERVLDRAPADVIHLVVDACHAEALVRPRDGDAQPVTLSPADVAAYLSQSTLARYPRVGVAMAGSSDGTAHEWDLYQSGVFTHELISALRGAADVNGDQRVEYSELGAFLAAVNREVRDPRARLRAIVKAPEMAPRAAIADMSLAHNSSRLTRIPAALESFSVEDERGNRLADGRPELGYSMSVSLPVNQPLFVRRGDQEAEFVLRPGADTEFGGLTLRARPMRSRGAVESALRAGLFLTPFGPAYYRGYVDQQDAVAVPLSPALTLLKDSPQEAPPPARGSFLRSSLTGAAAALLASSVVFAGMAWEARHDNQTAVEQASADDARRYRLDTALAGGFLLSGAACALAAFIFGGRT